MTLTESLGYIAAFLVLLTFSMKTMVRLRLIGIVSNVFFISYGYLSDAVPIMALHCILLPLNIWRLRQIMLLLRKVEAATHGDPDLSWLKSITTSRVIPTGECLFRKGEPANNMAFVVSGLFLIEQFGVKIGPGEILGEIGLLARNSTRTQTVLCVEDSEVLEITYQQVKELYFQSPKFGYYFLQLASRRLLENCDRLERQTGVCAK